MTEYAVLNYEIESIKKSIMVGVLYYDEKTRTIDLKIEDNWEEIRKIDKDTDIDFLKAYVLGMRKELENTDDVFKLAKYISMFVNSLKFSKIKTTRLKFSKIKTTRINKE